MEGENLNVASLYDRGVMMHWGHVLCLCMDMQRVSFGCFDGAEHVMPP